MSAWRALALGALAQLAACTAPRAPDRPAVLVAPYGASQAEVARVAAAAAGVASVTLRDDALVASSVLVLERRTPAGPLGPAATGRTLEEPVAFELVLRRSRCMLVRRSDGSAFELREARCVAAEPVAQPAVGVFNGAPAPVPATVRASNAPFAGVWKLVDEELRDAAGRDVPLPYAASGGRFGYIAYDPLGYMSVVLAWVAQPAVSRPEPKVGEAALALQRYNSYWGSYAVDEAASVVTHQTFGAVMPSFAGTNQERRFAIEGDRLALQPPPAAGGDQRTLTWQRVADLPNPTATHRRLIGFWKLQSFESRTAAGELLASSSGQTGFLVYTAAGHVMLHLMQPYRRRYVGSVPTADETMATYRSYTSYFGPYTVDEAAGVVVHHVDASFNSAAPGTELENYFDLSGRRLTLKAPATKDGDGQEVHSTMTWERLGD